MKLSALARFLIIFPLLYVFYLLYSAAPLFASSQTAPAQSNYPSTNTNPNVPNNLHNWTQTVMIEVMSAMTCQIAGVDPINPKQECLGVDKETGKIGFVQGGGGAIGVMGNLISTLYTPPLHAKDYFQNLAADFGIAKKTYAQGVGFSGLQPLMEIWKAFRNIVYLIFVVVFVVIGMAIMLRVKIDPRTVMTIQNQIPKLIIGIVLVTFSFAIAGFLIDLMYVTIYLVYGVVIGIPGVGDLNALNPVNLQGKSALAAAGGIGGIASITYNAGNGIVGIISDMFGLGIGDKSWANPLIHAISIGVGTLVTFLTEDYKVAGFSVPGVKNLLYGGLAFTAVESGLRWIFP